MHQRLVVFARKRRVRHLDVLRLRTLTDQLEFHGVYFRYFLAGVLAGAPVFRRLAAALRFLRSLTRGLDRRTHDHLRHPEHRERHRESAADCVPASTRTTCRFSIVRRCTPMWPAMRLPLNTRPGRLALANGTRHAMRDGDTVRGRHTAEVVALHDAGKTLTGRGTGDVDDLADLEQVDLEFTAGGEILAFVVGEAEFDNGLARGDLDLGVVTGQRLAQVGRLARARRRPATAR